MNNQWMSVVKRGHVLLCGAALFVTGSVAAWAGGQPQKQVISLGHATSPVLQVLKASRGVVNGRELMNAMRSRDRAQQQQQQFGAAALRAQMQSVEAVFADLHEIDPTEDDIALVDAARQAQVPVVLENVESDKMARFFGVGVSNALVIADYDPEKRMGRLTFGEPVRLEEVEEDPSMAEVRSFGHKLELVRSILASQEAKAKKFAAAGTANSSRPEAIMETGTCTQAMLNATNCYEWYSVGLGPVKFLPKLYGGLVYPWVQSFIDPEFFAGVYQVGNIKYARIRSTGGWGNTGLGSVPPLFIDTDRERAPFFTSYGITLSPTNMPAGWALQQVAPKNPNESGTLTVTTGWHVSASGDQNGGSLSAGYDATTSSTINVSDWNFSNYSMSPKAQWVYYMSGTYGCGSTTKKPYPESNDVTKMINYCWDTAKNSVNRPPAWSFNGNQYSDATLAEAVWFGQTGQVFNVNYQTAAVVNDVRVDDKWIYYDYYQYKLTKRASIDISVDTTRVR